MQEAHKVKYLKDPEPGSGAGPSRKTAMLKTALGTEILAALQDDGVTDILVNPDGSLWIDSADKGCCASGQILSAAMRERIIRLVASLDERVAHRNSPFVSTEIPLLEGAGVRFEGLLPLWSRCPPSSFVSQQCFNRISRNTSRTRSLNPGK